MSKQLIAIIAAVAVALVGVLMFFQLRDDGGKALSGAADVEKLLEGVPQKGNVLGRDSAPVTVREYVDYKCPVCAAASQGVVPTIIDKYVRPGKVKLELRPIAFIGTDSETGALAGLAVAKQNKMWQFTELMMRNQGQEHEPWITEELVTSAATQVGADKARFTTDFHGDEVVTMYQRNREAWPQDVPDQSTPGWVVTGPNGKSAKMSGSAPQPLLDAIEAALPK